MKRDVYATGNGRTAAINTVVGERTLQELYYPPFKAVVEQGGAGSVMGSYNRLNGTYACQNPDILGTLKHDWGWAASWWRGDRGRAGRRPAGRLGSLTGIAGKRDPLCHRRITVEGCPTTGPAGYGNGSDRPGRRVAEEPAHPAASRWRRGGRIG